MESGAASTISGKLQLLAAAHPDSVPPIQFPGGKDLTFAHLHHLVEAVAFHLRSSGLQPKDIVPIASDNTVQEFIMILAVIRCRGKAVPTPLTLTQDELEFYFSLYEANLFLTGPGDDQSAAARAATARRVPHAVVSIDVGPCGFGVSSFVLTSPPGQLRDPAAMAAAVGTADVINKPWDDALLLHKPGYMNVGYTATLTQKQLALCARSGKDLVNLHQGLASFLAGDDRPFQNQGLLEAPTCGASAGSHEVSQETGGGGVDRRVEKPHSNATVGADGGAGAGESDLKLKDLLSYAGGAVIAVSTTLLHTNGPDAAAEKASFPLLLLQGAVSCSLVGVILVTFVGSSHRLLTATGVFLYCGGGAALVASVLPPGYSCAALAFTVATVVGSFMFVLLRRTLCGPQPKAETTPEVSVPEHGRWLTRWLPNWWSRPTAGSKGDAEGSLPR